MLRVSGLLKWYLIASLLFLFVNGLRWFIEILMCDVVLWIVLDTFRLTWRKDSVYQVRSFLSVISTYVVLFHAYVRNQELLTPCSRLVLCLHRE